MCHVFTFYMFHFYLYLGTVCVMQNRNIVKDKKESSGYL